MNFSIIPAGLDFLRKGEALNNPGLWKAGGEALKAAVGGFILTLNPIGKALGYDLQITPEVSGSVAVLVVYVMGVFFTAATSPTVGLLPAKVAGPAGDAPAGGGGPLDTQVGSEPAKPIPAMEVRLKPPSNQEDAG